SDQVDIHFLIGNADIEPAYLTIVDSVLPAQLEFIASTDCISTGSVVRCNADTVETDTPQSIMLTVRAVAPGNPVTLAALVSHAGADPDTANNGASLSLTVNDPPPDSADLAFSMSPSAAQFIISVNLTMTYAVTNQGPNHAMNVLIIHELPPEMVFVSSSNCALES